MKEPLSSLLRAKGTKVCTISPSSPVIEAVRQMNSEGIGSLLVTDGDQVVGIFSERDVLTRVVDRELDPGSTPVSAVMTDEVVAVDSSMSVEDAMAVVTEKRCRHLPVMDGDVLTGMVSIGDLTKWMGRHHQTHIQDLVNYITGKYPG